MNTVISQRKPIQSRWFHIGKGYLCFAILRPPAFAVTIELRDSKESWEIAVSIISFSIVYQWNKRNTTGSMYLSTKSQGWRKKQVVRLTRSTLKSFI
ncbi:hypothetical protein LCGC14_0383500 [marine sediment metagenome]|uniref:Uncharacterized protein n=1 Tax=marine sediment metagenome TaxID=412755 RepID=A0A0F9VNX9_9ZZZZ